MTAVAEQIGQRLEAFSAQPKAEPWLQSLRDEAFAKYAAQGFPTTHNEEWRFTSVKPVLSFVGQAFPPANTSAQIPDAAKQHLGKYAPLDHPFVALNTAFLNAVKVIQAPKGQVPEPPIEITYEAPPDVTTHPRTLILVGPHAQCT